MQTITRQELKAKLDTGDDIKLVMTVGGWTFRAEHIPRSISFPAPAVRCGSCAATTPIILYSTNQHRQSPVAAFHALEAHSYACCYTGRAGRLGGRRLPGRRGERGRGLDHPALAPRAQPPDQELNGGCPHCDNGWSGDGWPPRRPRSKDGGMAVNPTRPLLKPHWSPRQRTSGPEAGAA